MSALYVHIPFCNHICTYCDFCKVFYKEDWADQYLDALSFEIIDKKLKGLYDTIYIGGGTPSSLTLEQLRKLFEILKPFSLNVKEFTIEVNPESTSEDKLDLMIDNGINRLSIGVQTFHDDLLKYINRHHSASQAITLIQKAKEKGLEDINVDLIYGLPYQKQKDIQDDIQIVDRLGISHVSIYSLILEDHTVLKNVNYQPLNDEQDALWYDEINKSLEDNGFIHYEVSNYYRKKASLHNLVYWHYEDYMGIGLGAHSLVNHHRLENTNSLTKYLKHQYLEQDHFITQNDEIFEKIMMGLRLTEGVSIEEIDRRFNIDFIEKYKNVIDRYIKRNMLIIKDSYLKTTKFGMAFLNEILVDFIDE